MTWIKYFALKDFQVKVAFKKSEEQRFSFALLIAVEEKIGEPVRLLGRLFLDNQNVDLVHHGP